MKTRMIVHKLVEPPLIFALIFMTTAAPAMAAKSNPHMGWRVIDFIIFVAIIVYYAKKPILNFFRNRKFSIKQSIEKAELSVVNGKSDLENADDRYSRIDDAIAEIQALYEKKAEIRKEAILRKARKFSLLYKQNAEELRISEKEAAKKVLLQSLFKKIEQDIIVHLKTSNTLIHSKINKRVIINLKSL